MGQWHFPLHSKSLRHSLCTASAVDKHITPVQSTEVQSPLKCNNELFLNHNVKVQLTLVKCDIFGRNFEKLKSKMCACVRERLRERERENVCTVHIWREEVGGYIMLKCSKLRAKFVNCK